MIVVVGKVQSEGRGGTLHEPSWLTIYSFIKNENKKDDNYALVYSLLSSSRFHEFSDAKTFGRLPQVVTFERFPCPLIVCAV